MHTSGSKAAVMAAILAIPALAPPAVAQEVAIKGALVRSNFQIEGSSPWTGSLNGTSLGGHVRFNFGRIALQPELHVLTRGARLEDSEAREQLRLEYMEIPLLLVVPVRLQRFELQAHGGPMLALETRCRFVFESDGLKTNMGCNPRQEPMFERRALDYGATAGAGVSLQIGAGRVLLEARRTWGMHDVYDGPGEIQLRNRTTALMLGYIVAWDPDDFE
jgi:hypothetical protein